MKKEVYIRYKKGEYDIVRDELITMGYKENHDRFMYLTKIEKEEGGIIRGSIYGEQFPGNLLSGEEIILNIKTPVKNMKNKHLKMMAVCEEIGYDFEASNYIIQVHNDGTMSYGKKENGEILTNRSSAEIIFKPAFMTHLKGYLKGRWGEEKMIKIIMRLVSIQQADKFLYNIINETGN